MASDEAPNGGLWASEQEALEEWRSRTSAEPPEILTLLGIDPFCPACVLLGTPCDRHLH